MTEFNDAGQSIWFLTHAAGTPDLGPNLRVYSIAKELVRRGFRCSIVGSSTFHKYSHRKVNAGRRAEETITGVRMVWLPTREYQHGSANHVLNQLEYPWRLYREWRNLSLPRPDVIVASSPPPFVAFAAANLGRKLEVPWVFEMRDLWPLVIEEISGLHGMHPYILLLKATERFAIRKADHLITVKPGDSEYLFGQYGRNDKTTYIPNGIDPETLRSDDLGSITVESLPKGGTRFVYVGSLTRYYLLEEFVVAYGRLRERNPDISLIIAGDGPRRTGLEELVVKSQIRDVHFLGRVPRHEVLPLLESCHVAIVGLRGGQADQLGISSNKLYEYMYARLPIVACYKSEHDPVTHAGCGITVRDQTSGAIEVALERMLYSPQEHRDAMADAGRDYVLRHHHLPDLAGKYGDLLNTLALRT